MDYGQARQVIEPHEGVIPHMYLDTNGFVTVGIGNMLADDHAACALLFRDVVSGAEASPQQITADFYAVHSQRKGMRAESYRAFTSCELEAPEISRLFRRRVDEFVAQLRVHYLDFDEYPPSAQLAILDLAWNLGTHALAYKWPRLTAAIRSQHWAIAAIECIRPQSSQKRNADTVALFHAALGESGPVPTSQLS